jgi:Alpha/beta hydrolase family
MSRRSKPSRLLRLCRVAGLILLILPSALYTLIATPRLARADSTTVAVLFTGFNTDPNDPTAGLPTLSRTLNDAFRGKPFASGVFRWDQEDQAHQFVLNFPGPKKVVLIGHSWGGGAALEFQDTLLADNLPVYIMITLDPIMHVPCISGCDGIPDPVNTMHRYSYVQTTPDGCVDIVTGPSGCRNIPRTTATDAESTWLKVYDDRIITHSNIDDPFFGMSQLAYANLTNGGPDLHQTIVQLIAPLLGGTVAAPALSGWGLGLGGMLLSAVAMWRLRRRAGPR